MNLEQHLRNKKIEERATAAAKRAVDEVMNHRIVLKPSNSMELETLRDCDTSPNCKKFDEQVNSND